MAWFETIPRTCEVFGIMNNLQAREQSLNLSGKASKRPPKVRFFSQEFPQIVENTFLVFGHHKALRRYFPSLYALMVFSIAVRDCVRSLHELLCALSSGGHIHDYGANELVCTSAKEVQSRISGVTLQVALKHLHHGIVGQRAGRARQLRNLLDEAHSLKHWRTYQARCHIAQLFLQACFSIAIVLPQSRS